MFFFVANTISCMVCVALPGVFTCRHIVVQSAEMVLVKSVGRRLMEPLPVFLEIIQEISITAVLENQVWRPCIKFV